MTYALITGASKGIGKAIAEELAQRKYNLLLVARSADSLKEIADNLSKKHHIKVAYLAIDLSLNESTSQVYQWCEANKYQVQILINNAGYGLSGPFKSSSIAENINMMHLNTRTLVQMCHQFLPMLQQQKQAYILNIASTAAYQAVPGLCLYAATKAFVLHFSRGLRHELLGSSISVTSVSPGATNTDFASRAKVGKKALKAAEKVNMTAEQVAKLAVNALFNKKPEIVTGFVNQLGVFFAWLLPKSILEQIAGDLYK
ncbi:SDR family NAD(P)-dependent oxidoreductase [Flavobacterium sp. GB2R13]|uniref:SDR family NAD(P)-dependent oxidoreductase n=1 Tax=Flavobacterium algoris TaxID=3398733 RepID=UPI003A84A495